jgi:nucleotide-binding universal stress UspA family protein
MKILVATDGSDASMKAVKRAVELAQSEKAEVTLMSVSPYSKDDFDEMWPSVQDKLEAEAAKALKKAKSVFDEKGIKVEAVLEAGVNPANNIIRRAQDGKFDLILLGSTGKSGIERAFMGSVAAKVVAQAPCSVSIRR